MTLQDLTSEELNSLKELSESKALKKLLEARLGDVVHDLIKEDVYDNAGMVSRAYKKGVHDTFYSLVHLDETIKEEYELREQEKELTKGK